MVLAILIGLGAVTTFALVNQPLVTSWVDAASSGLQPPRLTAAPG